MHFCNTSHKDVVKSLRLITGRLLASPQATAPLSIMRLIFLFLCSREISEQYRNK